MTPPLPAPQPQTPEVMLAGGVSGGPGGPAGPAGPACPAGLTSGGPGGVDPWSVDPGRAAPSTPQFAMVQNQTRTAAGAWQPIFYSQPLEPPITREAIIGHSIEVM